MECTVIFYYPKLFLNFEKKIAVMEKEIFFGGKILTIITQFDTGNIILSSFEKKNNYQ